MKTKLFIFLLIFTNCRINHTVQKYPLIATEKSSIWLEITDDFSYELVDQKNRYKLLKRKEYIFEGAHLLNSSLQTDNILLLIGFKTIGKSRDLELSGYELFINDKGEIHQKPKKLDYLDSYIFEAGRLFKKDKQVFIKEEIKPYGTSISKRDGEQEPLFKEYKVRYRKTLQISEPYWPKPISSLDYLNLAHSMKSYKLYKKAAALYTIGLNQQNRHLNILDQFKRQQIHFDFAESLIEAGYPKRAKIVLKSLGSRLNRKSKLRTPVYKLYKRTLKELGED